MVQFITLAAKSYDIDDIDGPLSFYGDAQKSIMINVVGDLDENELGDAYVNGIKISKPSLVRALNYKMLLVNVGEVMREYDRVYEVELRDFKDSKGKTIKPKRFKVKTKKKKVADPSYADHDARALIAARESFVLLKNEGNVLPLKNDETLNLFGDISTYRITAFGAPKINPRWCPNFMDALKDHSDFKINEEIADLYKDGKIIVPDEETLKKAKETSDTAIIYLTRKTGENVDNRPIKGEYYLSDAERDMIKAVTSVFDKTILLLNCGYPIEMRFIDEMNIKAILYTGFAGMLSSYALMETLDGRNNPSGKLPTTFPYDYFDTPASKNFVVPEEGEKNPGQYDGGILTYYCEDIYSGYRYFDSFGKEYAYGFGHGLSYTDFSIEVLSAEKEDDHFNLKVKVSNIGPVSGNEVIQVYRSCKQEKYELVNRSLCGFEKSDLLKPGESQILDLVIDDFALCDFIDHKYLMPAGSYSLWMGNSLDNSKVVCTFELKKDKVIREVSSIAAPVEEFPVLNQENKEILSLSKKVPFEDRIPIHKEKKAFTPKELPSYTGKKILWDDVKKDPSLLENFVAQMDLKELCALNCNAGNHWSPWQDGAAGQIPVMKKYGIKGLEVSDANAGVNIKKPNIGFPQSSSIAATFNKKIAYMVGKTIAEESKPYRIVINLGPGFNMQRALLNGRNCEYYSEDPFLSGTMAGYQGKGLEENGIGTTYKHFFANNAETLRKSNHSYVSERALREIYFKNFEYAFRVHKPIAVMNSYNPLNGIYPAESTEMMQDYVRGELGFDGIIMTDWDSYDTIDPVEMAKAGTCWISSGGKKYANILYKAAKEGKISKAVLQDNVKHVIKAFMKFDR
ncbi:MAG: glycoside hydrolase family 3 C-terminal domain-containing protein [Erysipelotrichaceae bacterium]|nr:glycoside hydrolase family 3 C-terminal domain-containing protein [Erysipelotrichaceae bacterium]